MTYLKSTLIASVAALAFTAAPALAGEKMHSDKMHKTHATAMHEGSITLTAAERAKWESKIKAKMSAEDKMKWKAASATERQMWIDKKIMKQINWNASEKKMMSLTSAERSMWESKIKANMNAEHEAKWAAASAEDQRKWMDKKITKKIYANAAAHTDARIINTSTVTGAEAMKRNDTIGEILQADGEPDPQMDREVLMSQGHQNTKGELKRLEGDNNVKNNAIVVPTVENPNVLTTVSCPVGTTAQPDMTCLVTGDYRPNA